MAGCARPHCPPAKIGFCDGYAGKMRPLPIGRLFRFGPRVVGAMVRGSFEGNRVIVLWNRVTVAVARPCRGAVQPESESNRRLAPAGTLEWGGLGLFFDAVQRVLGEQGSEEESAVGRQEFQRHMAARRLEEVDEEELKPLRCGGCLESEQFRQEMLERMDGKLGENHSGELHRETAEQKATASSPCCRMKVAFGWL